MREIDIKEIKKKIRKNKLILVLCYGGKMMNYAEHGVEQGTSVVYWWRDKINTSTLDEGLSLTECNVIISLTTYLSKLIKQTKNKVKYRIWKLHQIFI